MRERLSVADLNALDGFSEYNNSEEISLSEEAVEKLFYIVLLN